MMQVEIPTVLNSIFGITLTAVRTQVYEWTAQIERIRRLNHCGKRNRKPNRRSNSEKKTLQFQYDHLKPVRNYGPKCAQYRIVNCRIRLHSYLYYFIVSRVTISCAVTRNLSLRNVLVHDQ